MGKQAIHALGLALMLGAAAVPALGCDDRVAAATTAKHSTVLDGALQRLKQEQRAGLQQQSRTRLAELRSEAASALAQGAITGTAGTIKAAR